MGTTLSNALKSMEAHDFMTVEKLDFETFITKFKTHLKTIRCSEHSVCLADGGYFDYVNPQFGGHCDMETPCVEILADVNGKKGPNKEGKDRYTFLVTNRGIIPLGATETCTGLDCTAYVLANHKLWEGETTNSTLVNTDVPTTCKNHFDADVSCYAPDETCSSGYFIHEEGYGIVGYDRVNLTCNGAYGYIAKLNETQLSQPCKRNGTMVLGEPVCPKGCEEPVYFCINGQWVLQTPSYD